MAYTVRLVRDDVSGWFATMQADLPVETAVIQWSADFADLRQAESVLDVARDLAVQFNANAYTWKRHQA
jgi:trans-aconitate methyltransferase